MEDKLTEYRARKRKEEILPSIIKKIKKVSFAEMPSKEEDIDSTKALLDQSEEGENSPRFNRRSTNIMDTNSDVELFDGETSDLEIGCPTWSWLTIATYALFFLLWLTLYAIAINLEFGAVYFIVSTLYLLWKNTRTGPKKKGEVSAYSVFNPDCKAIEGTLTAEQFEREMRFGASSLH